MKISPINNRVKNISFGKFLDENARRIARKALTANANIRYMQPDYDYSFELIDNCDFFEVYTDPKTKKIKGRFTDEFVKENTADTTIYAQNVISNDIQRVKRRGHLEDLSKFNNLNAIASKLSSMMDALEGIMPDVLNTSPSERPYGRFDSYAAMRAEEEAYR